VLIAAAGPRRRVADVAVPDDEERDELIEEYDEEQAVRGMLTPSLARIAFARIEGLSLGTALELTVEDATRLLLEALVAGTRIEHYGRAWRMGQVRMSGLSIVGRIGFEAASVADVWDEHAQDFRDESAPAGLTSPFAIDPARMRVAFQLRSGAIRVRSFTGALQALMNAASNERWRVHQEVESLAFEDWTGSVDRIVRLRTRLERPNPDYKGREKVKELVEGANARMTEIAWTADPENPQGIDARDEVIREAIEHARKYGRARAVGERHGLPSLWDSGQEGVAEQRVLVTDPNTREVDSEDLRRELGDQSQEA
jgi:hypothetical protein